MSTTVSVGNGSTVVKESQLKIDTEQERAWAKLSSVIGYPSDWMSIIRSGLQEQGKSWHWKLDNTQVQLPKSKPLERGEALLIINAKTSSKAISNMLLLAENSNANLSVVYTEKPPTMAEFKTPSEVDQDFLNGLESGRSKLAKIEKEAKHIGVNVKTSFIWAESIDAITKNARADLIINETV